MTPFFNTFFIFRRFFSFRGDNQRLEFLGDSLLKYVSTNYLFRHFPRHHEGHLSLLKNSLVNKYTQAAVCSELGLDQYVIRREDNSFDKANVDNPTDRSVAPTSKSGRASANAPSQNVKYRADLLEAFIGALFVDKDLVWVERFCQVCFWPRLVEFILKQEWNDAKSKLQQCCLTFRSLHEDPEIAHYKVLEHSGPTNQRTYLVGVYFRGQRLATASGRSVQQAQMEAAKQALEIHQGSSPLRFVHITNLIGLLPVFRMHARRLYTRSSITHRLPWYLYISEKAKC
ncbi:hypothetical protein AHF37_04069 [Paragonimus kellicotti]|nr:hypothetical protein AHF37_04069 [Paragonimus kellicotti]